MARRAVICTAATLLAWIFHPRIPAIGHVLFTIAYISGAWDLTIEVWTDLKRFRFNTEFLMLLVAVGAGAIDAWAEGSLLLVLFSSSAAMEEYASSRTQREIGALLKGAPKTARLMEGTVEREVTVESLLVGDQIRVTAGEQVPVDFEIHVGESACDESMLTGEVDPVPKTVGDTALSGTLNLWGVIDGRVLRPSGDGALQRIIRLIHEAQGQRAPTQRFTDRFGTRYTAGVVALCVGLFLFAWLVQGHPPLVSEGEKRSAFYRAMTLLVVLSPCALVLSVPSGILSAIACGARHGVLFRGGTAVEMLAEVRTVAMDKTGTLTEGKLQLNRVECLEGSEADLLAGAAGLAGLSTHPISRSIVREALHRGIPPLAFTGSETIAGKGIRASRDGSVYALGNRKLLETLLSPAKLNALPPAPREANETWMAGPGLLGRLILSDRLRPESHALIAELHAAGLKTVMLTGDREENAASMGEAAGVSEIRAHLSPEQKVQAVESLKANGQRVAMIGDGVNDAPVLAAADVGVAMGARGSDAALEQADVVLMNDRLENFLFARRLSLRARDVIRQNLIVSLGTMTCMALLTLGLSIVPLWLGVAAHEGSTVLVVLNSLRLLFPPEHRTVPDK
jgi:Zn2+/Cd2+-exporting ATPase